MSDMTTVKAIFNSYAYNREFSYMVKLCQEVLERMYGFIKSSNRTHDGDIIYGYLVLMYGDYGTSPRSGWIENYFNEIAECINYLMEAYRQMAEQEKKEV